MLMIETLLASNFYDQLTVYVNENSLLLIYFLVPKTATDFSILSEIYDVTYVAVIFKWNPPDGRGPEAIVDNYTISILPMPLSHPISNVVYSNNFDVTLDYNVIYNATVTAFNCAGESKPVYLTDIEYGKNNYSGCSLLIK